MSPPLLGVVGCESPRPPNRSSCSDSTGSCLPRALPDAARGTDLGRTAVLSAPGRGHGPRPCCPAHLTTPAGLAAMKMHAGGAAQSPAAGRGEVAVRTVPCSAGRRPGGEPDSALSNVPTPPPGPGSARPSRTRQDLPRRPAPGRHQRLQLQAAAVLPDAPDTYTISLSTATALTPPRRPGSSRRSGHGCPVAPLIHAAAAGTVTAGMVDGTGNRHSIKHETMGQVCAPAASTCTRTASTSRRATPSQPAR